MVARHLSLSVAAVLLLASQSPAQSGVWFEQIDKIDPPHDAIAGNWHKTSEGLRTDASTRSRIAIPAKLPRQYDFRVQFTRHSGRHSIALFFTSGDGRATFEIDAGGQHLAGIQQIDGQTMQTHNVKSENRRLENGRKYAAVVKVRAKHVKVLLDDQVVATYFGDGSKLSLIHLWRMPYDVELGVGAHGSTTTFHSLELRTGDKEINEMKRAP